MRTVVRALIVAVALAACGDSDECAVEAQFVLRNDSAVALRARAPFAGIDTLIAVGDSVRLGRFEGEAPGSQPDVRGLMACLTLTCCDGDSIAYRLSDDGEDADGDLPWIFTTPDGCSSVFLLGVADSTLGRDAGPSFACSLATASLDWTPDAR